MIDVLMMIATATGVLLQLIIIVFYSAWVIKDYDQRFGTLMWKTVRIWWGLILLMALLLGGYSLYLTQVVISNSM